MKKLTLLLTFLALVGFLFNTSTSRAQVFTEPFDGTTLDLSNWEISAPLDGSTVSQNNALFLMNDDTFGSFCNTEGLFGPGVGIALRHKLTGDFDIQVGFSGFAGIGVDFVQAFINVFQDMDNQMHIKRIKGPSADGIQTVAKVGGFFNQNGVGGNSTSAGTLRIVRSGSTITTFDNLVLNHTINGAFTGDVIVSLVLFVPLGGYTSNVTYDNFTITTGTLVAPTLTCPAQEVSIDIKPGSYPNCMNINGQGVIPVAILGDEDFDVTQIDTSSLSFAGLEVRVRGKKGPLCHVEDVSGDFSIPEGLPDGYLDLVCQFEDDAPDEWILGDGDPAEVTGALFDGTPIAGSDEICISP